MPKEGGQEVGSFWENSRTFLRPEDIGRGAGILLNSRTEEGEESWDRTGRGKCICFLQLLLIQCRQLIKQAGADRLCMCGELCSMWLTALLICCTRAAQINAQLSNLFMKLYSSSSSNILLLFYFISQIPTVRAEVFSS